MRKAVGLIVLSMVLLLCGCTGLFEKKTNWNVTLSREDKNPYGSYLAYESLKQFFPTTDITPLSPGFRYNNMDNSMFQHGKPALLLAAGLDFFISRDEYHKLIRFASAGNEVVIFSRVLDRRLQQRLHCSIKSTGLEDAPLNSFNDGSINLASVAISPDTTIRFGYQGRSLRGYFVYADSAGIEEEEEAGEVIIYPDPYSTTDGSDTVELAPDTLGWVGSKPDALRFAVGKGFITLHAAPLVLSNYFLLQDNNIRYLEQFWNKLPSDYGHIYWHDYYKRSAKNADLGILLQYPATRWAFFLLVFTLLMYLLFESKRKQRIIPEMPPLENSSVSFAETVGRLYYNKGDHNNLAEKIIQHFLEWVRTHYFISTSKLDKDFYNQLRLKSGVPEAVVASLAELIQDVHEHRSPIDEKDLYHIHQTVEQFYKSYSK
ncbi:MAG: hypothetical protein EOP49_03240 [Sphingobacteriales bacterium]|nr:MAG: hypothetical protein EOP49_03240 [Sphingobacteriales bacterium]